MNLFHSLVFLLFFSGITFAQTNSDKKYFEGIVEYNIKSESYMQGVSENEIRERTGSILKFYLKDGDYLREYIDDAGYTLRKFLYKKDKNMIYLYFPISSPDTLYYSSASDTAYTSFEIMPGKKETVMSCNCLSSEMKANYADPNYPDPATIYLTYFFCPELPVDPAWHKNIYAWNNVIKIYKSVAIKFIENDPHYMKQTFTATKIKWQPVDAAIFKIDSALVLKEISKY